MPENSKSAVEASKTNPSINKESLPLTEGMEFSLFGEGRVRFFSTEGLIQLAQTCKDLRYCRGLIPELSKRLLQYIVYGEQAKAQHILESYPDLLLKKAEVKDYSGRTIIATPFQAALGAEDELMWEMMKYYFWKLEELSVIDSAQTEMKRQFDKQFPEGIESTPVSKLQPIYNKLATAIIDDDDNGQAAIEVFRILITNHNKVYSGKHFNMQHLVAACRAYTDSKIHRSSSYRVFWHKVIGFVQRQMPANYAQTFCSGLVKVFKNKDDFRRVLCFYDGEKLFPLSADDSGLGFDFAVYSYYVHRYPLSSDWSPRVWRSDSSARWACHQPMMMVATFHADMYSQLIEKIYRAKTESLISLEQELKSERQVNYSASRGMYWL